jgi:hypothetical protein
MLDASYVCEVVMKMTKKEITADDALKSITGYYFQSTSVLNVIKQTGGNAEGVLSSLAVEAFADSNEKFTKGRGVPLGQLAEQLVMQLTSCPNEEILGSLLDGIHMIPVLYAHGLVSENYINIQKEAYRIDTVGGGDWPFLLRTLCTPLDDRVYVERQSHLIARASAIIGSKIKERLELIAMMYEIPLEPRTSKLKP